MQGPAAYDRRRRPRIHGPGVHLGETDYEAFLATGDPAFARSAPQDEWDAIALNYTSGTTGNPKGVVYHHRGAYLAALGTILAGSVPRYAVFLSDRPDVSLQRLVLPLGSGGACWHRSVLAEDRGRHDPRIDP